MDADAGPPLPGRSVVRGYPPYFQWTRAGALPLTDSPYDGAQNPWRGRLETSSAGDNRQRQAKRYELWRVETGIREVETLKMQRSTETETKRFDAGSRYETQRASLDQDSISAYWGNARQSCIDASVARDTLKCRAYTPEPRCEVSDMHQRRISAIQATAKAQRLQSVNGVAHAHAHHIAKRRRNPQRDKPPVRASHHIIIQKLCRYPWTHAPARARKACHTKDAARCSIGGSRWRRRSHKRCTTPGEFEQRKGTGQAAGAGGRPRNILFWGRRREESGKGKGRLNEGEEWVKKERGNSGIADSGIRKIWLCVGPNSAFLGCDDTGARARGECELSLNGVEVAGAREKSDGTLLESQRLVVGPAGVLH
ncbi:hypothetical protein DFH09DRAFT_1083619 [Mycena vulgaris]|nr:hypothetical protein DFH09DRAFT_1083619 [Mycena vulgaris]